MKRNFSVMLPGAIGVDTGGLIAGVVLLWDGLGCMDGGTFPSAVDGAWASLYGAGGDDAMVLVLGLGDIDGSNPFIFWGVGADVRGGNVVTRGGKNDTGWCKPKFLIR